MTESGHNPIKKIVEELSHEAEQEKAASESKQSYLASADSGHLEQREREFRDVEKHWTRGVWLRYAQVVSEANGRKIKYLTLPAYYRLDVSLFQKHGLLDSLAAPDGNPVLAVAAFETDPTKYARMTGQSPSLQMLGLSRIEEALTDKKNKYYSDLLKLFPFDVINLDLTTSLTPEHEGPYSKVMRAIEEIMIRQASHEGSWALFVTFRNVATEWEPTALDAFLANLQHNLDGYPEVRESFASAYQCPTVKALVEKDVQMAITQSVMKWLVDRAHYHGMRLEKSRSYYYRRYEPAASYTITKLMQQFTRGDFGAQVIPTKNVPRQTWMNTDLVRCIERSQRRDVENILYNGPVEKLTALQSEIEELVKVADSHSGAGDVPALGN
jgi:hypothetical protein